MTGDYKGGEFMIKISYDKEGDVLEIRFSEKQVKGSEYMKKTGFVVDYDEDGSIVALEILSFSKRVAGDELLEAVAM
jgi:uncharacterized protein YuzE